MGLVVSFAPLPVYPQGKSPWYPLERRLAASQNHSGCVGEEKNSQPPTRNQTLDLKEIWSEDFERFQLSEVMVHLWALVSMVMNLPVL
jgi:hypothetical protein